jgi:hypothetical protein
LGQSTTRKNYNFRFGVQQGGNLYPFLFSIYLNDLQQFFEERNVCGLVCISDEIEGEFDIYLKLFVLLYADDTVLLYKTRDLIPLYILKITLYILPLISFPSNSCQRPFLQAVSKAFAKSINAQYNFLGVRWCLAVFGGKKTNRVNAILF